jgi:hypothetical protein
VSLVRLEKRIARIGNYFCVMKGGYLLLVWRILVKALLMFPWKYTGNLGVVLVVIFTGLVTICLVYFVMSVAGVK